MLVVIFSLWKKVKRLILHHYKVRDDLPQYLIFNALQCNDIGDIDPGIYKKINTYETKHTKVKDLMEDLEFDKITEIELNISDIIEMLPDENMMNNKCEIDMSCNYLIKTYLGMEQIAVDKEAVFTELSLKELNELFSNS